jgi:hypothetical protein
VSKPIRYPSVRAAEAIGCFASFVSALDEGRLSRADRERSSLRRLGFAVEVRPLGEPLNKEFEIPTGGA